ncbi:MAG: hypothetical protein M1133_13715 [Armatimonadetes bacterium]|nr:hypothetical protein [Armatimonadota bacterium]
MDKPALIRLIEERYGRKPPTQAEWRPEGIARHGLKDGFSIAIIGGGIAGPAFAMRVLSLASELGIRISVTLISRPSCNYCGGLVTNLSLKTMREFYGYEPATDVILSKVEEVILVNPRGNAKVAFESPLASVFRTSRFGQVGLDDNFRQSILAGLPKSAGEMLSVMEPAVATSVELPSKGRRGAVTCMRTSGEERVEADLIVLATGLRSLESKLVGSFRQVSGYKPPKVMPACVTEVDLSNGGSSSIGPRMLILNGIVKGSVVALIPKQHNWITIAALKKVLTMDDLHRIFDHPAVREFVQIGNLEESLVCNKVCRSGVFTAPARNFYGDGWVVLGDLTGCGRVLKDGYFAAFLGAELAAHTAVFHGCSREAFARHYHAGMKRFEPDNRVGMKLFMLNTLLAKSDCYNRMITDAMLAEGKQGYGGLAHAAFRALSTGELPYSLIALLFFSGLGSWMLKHPLRATCRT